MSYANEEPTRRTKPPLLIIFARGEKIRHISLRPWLASTLAILMTTVTLGYFGATAYLFLSDDILSALAARQAQGAHEYEDRMAALRSQLDRLGTDKLLQQRDVEQKVGELLEKQDLLAQRQERFNPLSSRLAPAASTNPSKSQDKSVPIPTPRPDFRATSEEPNAAQEPEIQGFAYAPEHKLNVPWPLRTGRTDIKPAAAENTESIEHSLQNVEKNQLNQVETLTTQAYLAAETIQELLELTGIASTSNVGGPFIELKDNAAFEERIEELDEALGRLDDLKETARRIPIINPLPGAKITSRFGGRKDPILNRVAYHSGMDFRAKKGDLIRATGAGIVVKAGWFGGYGRMVEIDHGSGITTRYAHLHEILVQKGDRVPTAGPVARAGNSGRSTGPHLHYEIRRNGEALNPQKFISAGRQILQIL